LVTFAVLFDIDGTLVSSVAAEEGMLCYSNAIRDVVGKTPNVAPGRFAGMADPQICQILLTELGLTNDKIDYFVPKVLSRMIELYRRMDKTIALNSGVKELLPLLVRSPRHAVGVLTGNLKRIAKEKLACAEILVYFSEFYCADRYFERARLVADAVNSCVTKYQLSAGSNVMIVGDTPRDIAATNASEATSIGIASSAFSMRQLSEAGAKQVYPSLKPTKQFLAGLMLDSQYNYS